MSIVQEGERCCIILSSGVLEPYHTSMIKLCIVARKASSQICEGVRSMPLTKFSFRKLHCIKMKFSIKDFFSKCDQSNRNLRIWSNLQKKF